MQDSNKGNQRVICDVEPLQMAVANASINAARKTSSLPTVVGNKPSQRALLLAFALTSSGCTLPFHRQRVVDPPPAVSAQSSPANSSKPEETTGPKENGSRVTDSDLVNAVPASDLSAAAHVKSVAFTEVSSRQGNAVTVDGSLQPTLNDLQRPAMTLADFESLAMANNPTIQQLAASTQKAAGYRQQVGLWANPTAGYQGVQIADKGTDQHTAFVEQEFVTAGKLGLNSRVLNEAVRAQSLELEAQKYRVQTDVRIKFYAALAAQMQVALSSEFQHVGKTGFELAELRKRAMEASQIEVLLSKIQMNQIDLLKQQAEVKYAAAWRELAAMVGNPELPPVGLDGELVNQVQSIDWTTTGATIFAGSPEYRAAQTRVRQAQINLERQGVQAIPNLTVQMAGGIDNGTNSGLINLQVGAPIPVFNKNQGNIAAARADYCRALLEVRRIENAIQARLAAVSNEYDTALAAVIKYDTEILPSARETLDLAEQAYKAGEFSFLEVLIVRRTYFESNLQMLQSQAQLAQANAKVYGFVLTGGLDATVDLSGDDSLRGQTFSQQ